MSAVMLTEGDRSFPWRSPMTKLAEALTLRLEEQAKPVLANHEIYSIISDIYVRRAAKYLRGDKPDSGVLSRTRGLLVAEGLIRRDADYRSLWRVVSKPDFSAEDLACSVDPFCYISHMSAMQRYGLTNRRPNALFLTEPSVATKRQLVNDKYGIAVGDKSGRDPRSVELPIAVHHPDTVRGRRLSTFSTKHPGDAVAIGGSFARIATIGQTFLDMIAEPERCGGMAHILDVWSEHLHVYFEDVLSAVEECAKPILRVRAGYIIEEYLGIADRRVASWVSHAQRGSSRVLAAGQPFAQKFSERWMLSLNV